jgi:hypothetical protein
MKKRNFIILVALVCIISIGITIYFKYSNYTITEKVYTAPRIIETPHVVTPEQFEETATLVCKTFDEEWAPGRNESILLDPIDNIYLGSVLSASGILAGSFESIGSLKDRLPITISTNAPNLSIKKQVIDTPKLSLFRDAVTTIIGSKQTGTGSPNITIEATEIFNQNQLNLMLQAGFSGGGNEVSASFSSFTNKSIRHFLVNITQVYYSISTDKISPNEFFKNKPKDIQGTYPVYVSNMKFGRRIWIVYETSSMSTIKKADLAAQFKFFAGKATTDNHMLSQEEVKNSSLKVLMVGGDLKAIDYIPTDISDRDNLKKLLRIGLFFNDSTAGAPLSYTLKGCADDKIFKIVNAARYTVRDCEVKTDKDTLILKTNLTSVNNACVEWTAGGDRNLDGDCDIIFHTSLTFEKNVVYCEVYGEWNEINGNHTQGKSSRRITLATLPENYVISSINSGKNGNIGEGKRAKEDIINSFGPLDLASSAFSNVTIIGDGTTSDDFGTCTDDNHSKIRNIVWNDLRLSYKLSKYTKK